MKQEYCRWELQWQICFTECGKTYTPMGTMNTFVCPNCKKKIFRVGVDKEESEDLL